MTSYYSVIRYVPKPIADESINVGLVTFAPGQCELTLTEDWSRARAFGRESPRFLRSALDELQKLYNVNQLTEEVVREMASSWHHQIQLTQPRASTLEMHTLHAQLAPELLRQPEQLTAHVGKRQIIKRAKDALRDEMKKRFHISTSRAGNAIRSAYEIEGTIKEHTLDVAIVNGVLQAAGIGLSLAQMSRPQLEREIDAVAFAFGDLRLSLKRKPVAVLARTVGVDPSEVQRAENIFKKMKVGFIAEKQIAGWSREIADKLPAGMFDS